MSPRTSNVSPRTSNASGTSQQSQGKELLDKVAHLIALVKKGDEEEQKPSEPSKTPPDPQKSPEKKTSLAVLSVPATPRKKSLEKIAKVKRERKNSLHTARRKGSHEPKKERKMSLITPDEHEKQKEKEGVLPNIAIQPATPRQPDEDKDEKKEQ